MPVPRSFRPYTVGTTPLPMFGTTLTDPVNGDPNNAQTVAVGDSSMFLKTDTMNVVPATGSTAQQELAIQVISVPGSTSVRAIFNKDHAAGDFAVLSWPCQNIMVQAVTAHPLTTSLFLCSTQSATVAGVGAFYDLYQSLFYSGPAGFADSDNTANYWTISASGTAYFLPSATQA